MWRLVGVELGEASASETEYACELCDARLVVPAGGLPPDTV